MTVAQRRKAGFGGRTIAIAGPAKAVNTPSGPDLALIQTFATGGRTVEAGDVAIFEMDVCNDQLDRDGEKFAREVLEDFVATLPGKGWLIGHQWGPPGEGLVFRSALEDRDGVMWVTAGVYLPTLANEVFINKVQLGVARFVSIGFSCPDIVEINGPQGSYWEWRRGPGGEQAEAYEVSSVFLGSQYDARVRKSVVRGLGAGGEHPEFRASLIRAVEATGEGDWTFERFLEHVKQGARRLGVPVGGKQPEDSALLEQGAELMLDTFEALVALVAKARAANDGVAVDGLVGMADGLLGYLEDDAADEGKTARLTKGRTEITAAKATRQAANKGDEAMGLTAEDRTELQKMIEAAMKGATEPLAASLKTVTDGQVLQTTELAAIKTGQTELTAKVTGIEGKVTAIEGKVTSFEGSMTDLVGGTGTDGKDVKGALELVVDRVEGIEVALGASKAAGDEGAEPPAEGGGGAGGNGNANRTPGRKGNREIFGNMLRPAELARR